MKKHLIAAAVAGAFAVPAMAQVTVSGLIDAGFYGTSSTVAAGTKSSTNIIGTNERATSTINFASTEDLGGGLKAGFRLEANFANSIGSRGSSAGGVTASTSLTTSAPSSGFVLAQSFVELSGGFGAIKIGRVNSPTLAAAGARSPFGTNTKGGGYGSTSGAGPTRNTAIDYSTPSISGVSARIHHSPKFQSFAGARDSTATTTAAQEAITEVGLFYSAGPLSLAVANHDQSRVEEQLTISGSYNLGPARVWVGYHTRENSAAAPSTSLTHASIFSSATEQTGAKSKGYNVGVSIPLGAVSLLANTAKVEVKDRERGDGHAYGVGVDYALSKRTVAYFRHSQVESDESATTKNKATLTGVGISHSF